MMHTIILATSLTWQDKSFDKSWAITTLPLITCTHYVHSHIWQPCNSQYVQPNYTKVESTFQCQCDITLTLIEGTLTLREKHEEMELMQKKKSWIVQSMPEEWEEKWFWCPALEPDGKQYNTPYGQLWNNTEWMENDRGSEISHFNMTAMMVKIQLTWFPPLPRSSLSLFHLFSSPSWPFYTILLCFPSSPV